VSKSLVSLVLNDSAKVSEPSRQAVLQAIADLGYTPNAQARALSAERTRNIALILKDMRYPWFVEAIEGVNAALAAGGLRMLIGDQRLDLRAGETAVRAFGEMCVDGAILVGSLRKTQALLGLMNQVPTVMMLGSRPWPEARADALVTDDAAGIALAMSHLRGLGHERIAHIGVSGEEVGDARRAAYESAMRADGLDAQIAVEVADKSEDGGFRAAVRLLTRKNRPTAIVAYNDMTAIGALSAAKDLGIDVPGACSITGYDNMDIARTRAISLTTIDQATLGVGQRAVAMLMERMRAPGNASAIELVDPTLVARLTTGAAG
jgi:DNA-binding LacI/PurR family transcriptional regulator